MPSATGPSGPTSFSTHGVTVEGETAVKRFRSPVAGDERRLYGNEALREWRALELLARYAPGLAPRPVRAHLNDDPPLVVMTRVPGTPLGTAPASEAQQAAIASALDRLHHAIPPAVLTTVSPSPGSPQHLPERIRDMARTGNPELLDLLPRHAHREALHWLETGWLHAPVPDDGQPVFAQGDPNLANRLWDGREVRLVDFEASGRSDQATELADFVEHPTVWAHAAIDAEDFLSRFDLRPAQRRQVTQLRRLYAAFWIMRLRPGGNAYQRNPAGTFERQATRLLSLLDNT